MAKKPKYKPLPMFNYQYYTPQEKNKIDQQEQSKIKAEKLRTAKQEEEDHKSIFTKAKEWFNEPTDETHKPQGMGDFRLAESKISNKRKEELASRDYATKWFKDKLPFLGGVIDKYADTVTKAEDSKPGKFFLRSGEKAANTAFLNNDEATVSTGNKKLDFVADILGGIGGFVNPQAPASTVFKGGTTVAERGLEKIAPKLAKSKLATNVIGGAGAGAATGTAEGIIEGKNVKDTAKNVLKRAGEFATVGAVGYGVGKVAEKGVGKLGEVLSGKPKFATNNKNINDLEEIIRPKKSNNITIPFLKPTIKQVEELKAPKEIAPTKIINESTPPVTLKDEILEGGPKERKFSQNSVLNSQVATEEIKQGIKETPLTYEPITNKETFNKATEKVKQDPVKALEYFNSPSKGVNADDVAVGEALITKAIKEGNHGEANRLIADLAEKLTTAGQAVQAASIFKRLTPEGMLLYAQRMVNSTQKDLFSKYGHKAPKVELTPEDATFILDTMKKAVKLPDGREKDIALGQVNQLIANKVPASLGEKVKGLQRIAMLLNPKTMNRNLIGNLVFSGLDNASNAVATPIDMLASKFTGKRTAALPSLTGQFKSGLQGVKETLQDAKLGINTYNNGTQFELPNKRIFDTNALNKVDQVTRVALELGDRPFYRAAYDDVLRQQMKANGITEPTQEMIEQAHKIAQQRTYQDTNGLTKAFKKAQTALNEGGEFFGLGNKDFGVGNVVLPFVKTPANILSRALEYSPAGLLKTLKEAINVKRGTFDQRAFVDSISRSVSGTALIMAGYDLAKKGYLTGSSSKDKDKAAFERSLGKNDFAFKIGDKYYTYDWAQPASMGLAIGADIFLQGKGRKDAENVVADAVKSGGETLFKQSLLQGLQRFMGGMSPIDSIESTALNAPTQFIPTLSNQVNQVSDPIQRNTYSQGKFGTAWNLIKAKIPGASETLEPKIDTFGNTVKRMQGSNSPFNVFLNPGETTEYKPNKLQSEILKLYESTGNNDVFPKVVPKYFTSKGERFDLTPKEQTTFQRSMGKRTQQLMNEVANYQVDNETKAKLFKKAIEKAYDEAKEELKKNRQK